MGSRRCCVLLAVATSVVSSSAVACKSFSAEDTAVTEPADGGADGAPDALGDATIAPDGSHDTNGCPTNLVFRDDFDDSPPSAAVWSQTLSGGGMIATTKPGFFVASVGTATGDAATIDHRFALPKPSKLVCITLHVGLEGEPASFSGGYVVTMQTDLRADKNDTTFGFVGFGLDKGGVFTNVQDSHAASQSGRMMMPTSTGSPLSTVIYKIESNGASSLVTILLDGAQADRRTLQLSQVADIELQLGPDASSKSGGFGEVTFTLDSIAVTAE